jgi:hypothetical protein
MFGLNGPVIEALERRPRNPRIIIPALDPSPAAGAAPGGVLDALEYVEATEPRRLEPSRRIPVRFGFGNAGDATMLHNPLEAAPIDILDV